MAPRNKPSIADREREAVPTGVDDRPGNPDAPDPAIDTSIQREEAAREKIPEARLPWFQSHKKVQASKITGFGGTQHVFTEHGRITLNAAARFFGNNPEIGWYFVQYENGYQSASPPEAFEGGYSALQG